MAFDKNGKELPKGITWIEKKQLYMARFTYQGTPYTFYDKDLKTIKKTLTDKRYEVEHGLQGKADKVTLNKWYETWLREYKIPTVKETTVITYENAYETHIRDSLGKRQLKTIKPIHIQKLYNDFIASGRSTKYLSNLNSMLYNIFELAVKNDLILKNPCTGATLPTITVKERRVLTSSEQEQLLNHVHKEKWSWYAPMLITLLGTGMRIGECLALTWNDIDFENKQISINKTLSYIKTKQSQNYEFKLQTPKTKTSKRFIPMQTEVEKALKQQRTSQKRMKLQLGEEWQPLKGFEDTVFTSLTGTPQYARQIRNVLNTIVNQINREETKLAKEQNREPIVMEHIHPHCLRHTFATRCFELDIPPKTVQSLLGHSSIQMTMDLYTHVSEQKKQKDMQKLEGLFQIG